MKKGQIREGIVMDVKFPNKGECEADACRLPMRKQRAV